MMCCILIGYAIALFYREVPPPRTYGTKIASGEAVDGVLSGQNTKMGDNAVVFGVDLALEIEAFFRVGSQTLDNYRKIMCQCYDAAQNCPVLQQTLTTVSEFAESHGDQVGVAGGFLVSSFLLYKSVTLGGEIEGFFDEIEELKGQFREKNAQTFSMMQLHDRIPQIIASRSLDPKAVRQYFLDEFRKSKDFFRQVERLLDAVDDLIQSVLKAKSEAEVNARLSAVVGILAGFALVTSAPVAMPIWLWRTGLALTTGMSAGSTALSLKNSRDAQKAATKLNELKRQLRQLRSVLDQFMESLMTILFQ